MLLVRRAKAAVQTSVTCIITIILSLLLTWDVADMFLNTFSHIIFPVMALVHTENACCQPVLHNEYVFMPRCSCEVV